MKGLEKWLYGNVRLVVQKKRAGANPENVIAAHKTVMRRKADLFL